MFRYFNKKALFDNKNSVFIESLFILFPDTVLVLYRDVVNLLTNVPTLAGYMVYIRMTCLIFNRSRCIACVNIC